MTTLRTPLAVAALAVIVAACSGGGAAASLTPPPDADVTVSAKDNKFDQAEVTVPAATPFKLFFRNLDAAAHNVAIYTDNSASEKVYVGEIVTNTAVTYDVPAIEPGSYFFRCDVHPDMTGTIVAAS